MYAHLSYRNVISVTGSDRLDFLQGMLTQDLRLLSEQPAVYTLRLNRTGRILGDAWLMAKDDHTWWMDVENAAALASEFALKRLRYKVEFTVLDAPVFAWWGGSSPKVGVMDTRHSDMGWRVYEALNPDNAVSVDDYRRHTLTLGVPDGSLDFEIGRAMPLPWGCEPAIGWDKGCYVGQEPVARSHYQGVIRQHIVPVLLQDDAPYRVDQDGNIIDNQGIPKGRLVSRFERYGLALVSTDVLDRPLPICY